MRHFTVLWRFEPHRCVCGSSALPTTVGLASIVPAVYRHRLVSVGLCAIHSAGVVIIARQFFARSRYFKLSQAAQTTGDADAMAEATEGGRVYHTE